LKFYSLFYHSLILVWWRLQWRFLLGNVLHCLHELFLVELVFLLRGLIIRWSDAQGLAHGRKVGVLGTLIWLRIIELVSACLRHRSILIVYLKRSFARKSNLMLLFHLVYLFLLLLHNFRQLKFVLELLWGNTTAALLGWLARRTHLRLAVGRVHLLDGLPLLFLNGLVGMLDVCRANLIGNSQLWVCLPVVHFNGGWSWTLSLVSHLDLASANLNRRCVLIRSNSALLLIRNWWKPLSRSIVILLLLALRRTHDIALRKHTLGSTSQRDVVIGDGHLRIVPHLTLLHHLSDLRGAGACHINFIGHVPVELQRLGWLSKVLLVVSLRKIVLPVDRVLDALFRCDTWGILIWQLTIVLSDHDVRIEGLVDDRLDRFAFFLTRDNHRVVQVRSFAL